MKKNNQLTLFLIFFSLIICSYSPYVSGCPTCVGRIEKNSPPFFSNEHYLNKETPQTPTQLSTWPQPDDENIKGENNDT